MGTRLRSDRRRGVERHLVELYEGTEAKETPDPEPLELEEALACAIMRRISVPR